MLSVAQLDERIEKCLAILADNPHSQVFAALADAYRKRGEFGRAFAVCKSGLKHFPDYAPAHVVMAKLYVHQGMFDDALRSLKKAEAQDGVTRATEFLEAEILIGLRRFEEAGKLIERLRITDRSNPDVKQLITQLRNAQQNSGKTQKSVELEPEIIASSRIEQMTHDSVVTEMDWSSWASSLVKHPRVRKVFAVKLSESGTTPYSVVAESGAGYSDQDCVSICTALFSSIDADCRARKAGTVSELRVEHNDGEIWCRRADGCLIGFAGDAGIAYGAVRQAAIDGAARVKLSQTDQ